MNDKDPVHRGSGDFLADQGIADPDEFLVKALLNNGIARRIYDRDLSQPEAARILDMSQVDVSSIVDALFDSYPVWLPMKSLARLGSDIVISVRPDGGEPGIVAAFVTDAVPVPSLATQPPPR